MGSATQFLYQKLVFFVSIFWFSIFTNFPPLFRFFRTYLFRFKTNDSSSEENSDHTEISSEENSQKDSNPIELKLELSGMKTKQDAIDFTDGFGRKETPEFCLKFKFPTYEEFSRSRRENGDSISFEAAPDKSASKNEFMPVKGFNGSIEEPEVLSFNAKVANTDVNGGPLGNKDSFNDDTFESDKDSMQINSEAHVSDDDEVELHYEKDSLAMDSDSDSLNSSPLRSVRNRLIDSSSDGFLSDGDFGGEFELDSLMDIDGEKAELHGEMSDENHLDELRKLEEAHLQNAGKLNSDFLSEKDFHGDRENFKHEELGGRNHKPANTTDDSEKVNSKNRSDWDSEDSNKLETLWEHQELIEQLKMELKKVRATGLPTILEESESPKITEDLQPWKIDEKFQRADRMDELHNFYKSYRERMRKFDILNYQKMCAIGFLQLKNPLESTSSQKYSVPSIESLLSQNLSLCKRKKIGSDPMMKFVKELQGDLEVVYVGQMCLSWEILHWQYGKALELWESDPRGIRQYNEVAGEFQQFQVLMQRFIEDEPFQGPRVQNYVKNRCILRNLLQTPVIREDSTKDRKKAIKRRERGDYAITSDMLVEIMEESIRIFWRFVRADKDCSYVIVKCRRGPHVELQDPADSELLMEVRANLQKKEKKLKDLLRSGNCILKRFRKCQEDDSDQVLYFFSQVDMKLVSRVLNMSRITTDQLIWCQNKLSNISLVNRKISVEPSFLLFPC